MGEEYLMGHAEKKKMTVTLEEIQYVMDSAEYQENFMIIQDTQQIKFFSFIGEVYLHTKQ